MSVEAIRIELSVQTIAFRMMTGRVLGVTCLLVLCGILIAGLWPFRAPKNEVSWSSDGNGLLFGEYGSILSSGAFKANKPVGVPSCSLEIWLQPSFDRSGTILAFYSPENPDVPFQVWQSHGNLGIRRSNLNLFHQSEKTRIYLADFFPDGRPVFITISSGPAGTAIYRDGVLVRKVPEFRVSSQDLAAQIVMGNAPGALHAWSGMLKGVAIYDRELASVEVLQHYANWTNNTQADLAKNDGILALYLFNEGKGSVVHNQIDSTTDLLIPKRFFVLREEFLEPPWSEFYPAWSYWSNLGVNIAGFVPFGFFFCGYLLWVRKIKRAVMVTVVLGFIVSLTIEVLQAFLPTRNSGMTDLITNTSGTALGSMLWTWVASHFWFARRVIAPASSVGQTREGNRLTELCNRDAVVVND
jgi:hypothetical protein